MSENTVVNDLEANEVPTSYSSSTPAAATNRPAIKAP
ncbi:MAG: 30S ribosomal protein S9, partial [Actinobacteria bacterium]|nr:30S ribosomal protein S9 [Actinomycetota bacterium]